MPVPVSELGCVWGAARGNLRVCSCLSLVACARLCLPVPVPSCLSLPACLCLCLQLDARNFTAFEWPRIREGIAVQTYEVLQER